MPLYTLDKHGIGPDTFFAKTQVTGSHENAVLALAQGTVDVAATGGTPTTTRT
jgi:phosphonate transport system substrate-binding protein